MSGEGNYHLHFELMKRSLSQMEWLAGGWERPWLTWLQSLSVFPAIHPPALSPTVSSLSWRLWAHTLRSARGPIHLFGALPPPCPPHAPHPHLSSGIVLTWRVSVLHAWLLAGFFLFQVATWRSGNQGVCQAAPGGSLSTDWQAGACLDCIIQKPVLHSTKSMASANVPHTLQRWAVARGLTLERPDLTWNEVELTGGGV